MVSEYNGGLPWSLKQICNRNNKWGAKMKKEKVGQNSDVIKIIDKFYEHTCALIAIVKFGTVS